MAIDNGAEAGPVLGAQAVDGLQAVGVDATKDFDDDRDACKTGVSDRKLEWVRPVIVFKTSIEVLTARRLLSSLAAVRSVEVLQPNAQPGLAVSGEPVF